MSNPFSDQANPNNPYASPAGGLGTTSSNPVFVPALILLVLSICWTLYVIVGCVMVLSPTGPFQNFDPMIRTTTLVGYCLMVVANLVFIAGAIAMLRLGPKWLAWTGCILGLVPVFGPCFGLTIPIAIWCLVVLRRPEVNAKFSS
jgi:hypothetical protein